jgi:hypothetical protein
MDSDKEKPRGTLNETKKRIRAEFDEGPGFAWSTRGREIENYIALDVLRESVEAVRPGLGARVGTGQFDFAIPALNPRQKNSKRVDKLKVAREVADRPADLSVMDLNKQIQRLVDFIRRANA